MSNLDDLPPDQLIESTIGPEAEPPHKLTEEERDILLDLVNLEDERRELLLYILQVVPFQDVLEQL